MPWLTDVSRPLLLPSELRHLVETVYAEVSNEDEGHWIEWKAALDLNAKTTVQKIAKTVLSFANRDPEEAAERAGGHAYMLIGVTPRDIGGVTEVDHARLQGQVCKYIGDEIRWSPEYISCRDKSVLVVVVKPPAHGDRISVLRTTFDSHQAGAVFVRSGSISRPANPADMDMLQRRLLARGTERLELRPILGESRIARLPDLDAFLAEWVKQERLRLLADDPEEKIPQQQPLVRNNVAFVPFDEPRYAAGVEQYLERAAAILRGRAAFRYGEQPSMCVQIVVPNSTEEHYERVRLAIQIYGKATHRKRSWSELRSGEPDMPDAPRRVVGFRDFASSWSSLSQIPDIGQIAVGPRSRPPPEPFLVTVTSGRVDVQFNEFDLRVGESFSLQPVPLQVAAQAGEQLTLKWSATAANLSGRVEGTFELEVVSSDFPLHSLPGRKPARRR